MPSSVLVSKIRKPSLFRSQEIANKLRAAARTEGRAIRSELKRLVAPWQNEKPDFKVRQQVAPTRSADINVTVFPVGSVKAVNKFFWLDKGTKIRYAHMSRDFKRKSHPRTRRVQSGNTGKPYFKKDFKSGDLIPAAKNPGIKPRGWLSAVTNERQPIFRRSVNQVIRFGATNKIKQP